MSPMCSLDEGMAGKAAPPPPPYPLASPHAAREGGRSETPWRPESLSAVRGLAAHKGDFEEQSTEDEDEQSTGESETSGEDLQTTTESEPRAEGPRSREPCACSRFRGLCQRSGLKIGCKALGRQHLLLAACLIGVTQYGMVLVFGVIAEDLDAYYGLSGGQGDALYACMNFGACALSFVPGLCCARFGPVAAMAIGSACAVAAVSLQIVFCSPAVGTVGGLGGCYLLFGLGASFYNVIGSFAPLAACDQKDVGKVSAVVQVCLALSITIQSGAYSVVKAAGGDFMRAYLVYALLFNGVCGGLMCLGLWLCRSLLQPSRDESPRSDEGVKSVAMVLRSAEFACMSALFVAGVGFSFSFLDIEGKIALEMGVDEASLAGIFGVLSAVGRVLVSVPLDYTNGHPLGGAASYIVGSMAVFGCGLLCLILPAEPGAAEVHAANALVALGYGGMLGIVPPALRLFFGGANSSLIYGILYLWVSVSQPLWGLLATNPEGCIGVACYRRYCLGGLAGLAATTAVFSAMIVRGRRQRRLGGLQAALLDGERGAQEPSA